MSPKPLSVSKACTILAYVFPDGHSSSCKDRDCGSRRKESLKESTQKRCLNALSIHDRRSTESNVFEEGCQNRRNRVQDITASRDVRIDLVLEFSSHRYQRRISSLEQDSLKLVSSEQQVSLRTEVSSEALFSPLPSEQPSELPLELPLEWQVVLSLLASWLTAD